jgi:hypothetical protein
LLEPETDKDPEKVYYTSINRFKFWSLSFGVIYAIIQMFK